MARKRVAILISGRGSNMAALIAAAADPGFAAEVVLVLANRPDAEGLMHAAAAGIPAAIIDHTRYGKDRKAFDHALEGALEEARVDLVCLAGFMRLLTPWLVERWAGRMLNIHPALLPAFKGLDTHQRALATGVKIYGASVHFVVPEMDSGPIIVQAAVPVIDDDTAATLGARVLALEHRIYPLALRLVAEGRVRIAGARCIVDGAAASGCFIVPDL